MLMLIASRALNPAVGNNLQANFIQSCFKNYPTGITSYSVIKVYGMAR